MTNEEIGKIAFGHAWDWYKYGLEHKNDRIVKFVMHWLAFNWLYSAYEGNTDTQKIASFYKANKRILDNYDPFLDPAIDIFLEGPVRSLTASDRDSDQTQANNLFEKVKRHDANALLRTIYRVRCNLFHGAKSPHVGRDRQLVESSSAILEKYLKTLLQLC